MYGQGARLPRAAPAPHRSLARTAPLGLVAECLLQALHSPDQGAGHRQQRENKPGSALSAVGNAWDVRTARAARAGKQWRLLQGPSLRTCAAL